MLLENQTKLFGDDGEFIYNNRELPDSSSIRKISFRNEVEGIPSTTYLTHSIYYYPAKFIPHVVKYAIEHYSNVGDTVVDCYAGSGTVGLEAYIANRNCYLLDLSPLLNHIMPIKIVCDKNLLSKDVMKKYLDEIIASDEYSFTPEWTTIDYWYDKDILDFLKHKWGWIKNSENNTYIRIIEAELIRLSKYFSYAEHKMPKLFRSKQKREFMHNLLATDWKSKFNSMLIDGVMSNLEDINLFISLTAKINPTVKYFGGVDTPNYTIPTDQKFDLLITSPPYMQAQEYLRTIKMDLFWLGHSEKEIKELAKLEIPYRKPDNIIHTKTLDIIRENVKDNTKLNELLDSYFCYTIRGLEVVMSHIKKGGKACIFIGNPTVDGKIVEIWRILAEYFMDRGFKFIEVFDDEIKARQLFGSSRNNKNPDGMKSEYFLVLEKIY